MAHRVTSVKLRVIKKGKSMKILILCTGNSCRSQMAEGFLNSFSPVIEAVSAGTNPSSQVHPKAIQVMAEIGIIPGESEQAELRDSE